MRDFTSRLAREGAVLVTVQSAQGSSPRDAGAWMGVFADDVAGTIGGGHLEFEAIARARRMLREAGGEAVQSFKLGPSLGQCCGGVVQLRFERVGAADIAALQARLAPRSVPVALFGGGHVGKALVRTLAPLPFAIHWIDSRDEIFPGELPENVECEHSDPVHGLLRAAWRRGRAC